MLGILIGRTNSGEILRQQLDDFPLDRGLRKVLQHYLLSPELKTISKDWLLGEQLSTVDLQRLDLPPAFPSELEQENIARSVVLSLIQLAGDTTTLFLCFDEVEGIQAGNFDAPVLKEFAALVTMLRAETGPRVIATFIRPTFLVTLTKAVETSNLQKMSQVRVTIPAMTWEQTVQIARARLDADPACRIARQQHTQEPDWPLGTKFLESTFTDNRRDLTPRHLIRACRLEFKRLQTGQSSSTEGTVDSPPASDLAKDLTVAWETRRKEYFKKLASIQFDKVMAIGLPWLLELLEASLVRVQEPDKRLEDVNLVFQPIANGARPLGISYCNQEPRALWRRLDRLVNQWKAARGNLLESLVLLRAEAEHTTDAGRTRLDILRKGGVRVILVQNQQLAELASFQNMLTATLNGDLTRHGKPIATTDYTDWARANLSSAVKELLLQVFETKNLSAPKKKQPRQDGLTANSVVAGKSGVETKKGKTREG